MHWKSHEISSKTIEINGNRLSKAMRVKLKFVVDKENRFKIAIATLDNASITCFPVLNVYKIVHCLRNAAEKAIKKMFKKQN